MFCPTCGSPLEAGVAFCGNCGTAIGRQEPIPPMEPAAPYAVPNPYTAPPAQELPYVVLQMTVQESLPAFGSGRLTELERLINEQAEKGYRLHTVTSFGRRPGSDLFQATLVFEKLQ